MRTSYDLTPTTEIFASLIYSVARTENIPAQGNSSKSNMTMRCDNAFLYQTFQGTAFGANGASPAAFATACGAAIRGASGAAAPSTASFTYGSDWANIPTDQLMFLNRTMRRYTVGGDGTFDLFGKTWSWDSYFQHGGNDTGIKIYNMPLSGGPFTPNANGTAGSSAPSNALSRCNLAQDAVFNSVGQIVCRNTL